MRISMNCMPFCILNSYDTWVSSEDVTEEPEPQPQHQGQWEVKCKNTSATVASAVG